MPLHINSCERIPETGPARMAGADLLAQLLKLGYGADHEAATTRFANYTGANERTVRRWCSGDLDIPPWVPVLLRLHERLTEALAWSEERGELADAPWRAEAEKALWVAWAYRETSREARRRVKVPEGCFIDHIDGDPTNNDPNNLAIVGRDGRRVT